jgi:hypothetical protein
MLFTWNVIKFKAIFFFVDIAGGVYRDIMDTIINAE